MQGTRVSYSWRQPDAPRGYRSGVSLHSHTNQSKESLHFLATMAKECKLLRPFFARRERRVRQMHGIQMDYSAAYWTPPLTPRLAFDLEQKQIEDGLGLSALVSLSDHDNINAPLMLRSIPTAGQVPISVEWTVPCGEAAVHLGIHNLPAATCAAAMQALADFTANPSAARLTELLADMAATPGVLIVLNHPIWDIRRVGRELHRLRVDEFLARNNQFLHAFELNGLRNWQENREASELAQRWGQITISGGDRHGVEPNANVNLSHATCFDEFVHEVRCERMSHVHFMPQYAEPWKYRVLQTALDGLRNYPDFPLGMRKWDERVFHRNTEGGFCPLRDLWRNGHQPHYVRYPIAIFCMLGMAPVSGGLRYAWRDPGEVQAIFGEQELTQNS